MKGSGSAGIFTSAATLSRILCLSCIVVCVVHAAADLKTQICVDQKPIDQTICNETLSLPSFAQCDDTKVTPDPLRCAGQLVIQVAINATGDLQKLANSTHFDKPAVQGKMNPAQSCVHQCNTAIGLLKACSSLLKKTDDLSIGTLNLDAAAADTNIETCNDEFGGTVYTEPANIKAATAKAKGILGILLVISNMLKN